MASGKWISYLRVSTDRQGVSGLGIEAQRASVADYLNGGRWKLIKEFVEVESGKRTDRPQLDAALTACRLHGAKLVIAKLDRLSRDAYFLLGRRPRKSDGQLVTIDADMRALGIAARQQRAADRATDVAPTIKALQAAGATSLRAIAAGLNAQGIPTAKGNGQWSAVQVQRVLERL